MTVALYVGLDVSLETTSICVVVVNRGTILEAKAVSNPVNISDILGGIDGDYERISFETGPLSWWLYNGLTSTGTPAECIEARHAKAAKVAMNRNIIDRKDVRSLARLV